MTKKFHALKKHLAFLPFRKLLLALMALLLGNSVARAQEVTVFTAENLPSMGHLEMATTVHVLAPIEGAFKSMSFPWPGSDEAAKARASEILNSPDGQQRLKRLRTKANSAAMAWLMGIDYLPAVLVSPGYVVYGVYDVKAALAHVEGYHAQAR